jgi:hypothetical protein
MKCQLGTRLVQTQIVARLALVLGSIAVPRSVLARSDDWFGRPFLVSKSFTAQHLHMNTLDAQATNRATLQRSPRG